MLSLYCSYLKLFTCFICPNIHPSLSLPTGSLWCLWCSVVSSGTPGRGVSGPTRKCFLGEAGTGAFFLLTPHLVDPGHAHSGGCPPPACWIYLRSLTVLPRWSGSRPCSFWRAALWRPAREGGSTDSLRGRSSHHGVLDSGSHQERPSRECKLLFFLLFFHFQKRIKGKSVCSKYYLEGLHFRLLVICYRLMQKRHLWKELRILKISEFWLDVTLVTCVTSSLILFLRAETVCSWSQYSLYLV